MLEKLNCKVFSTVKQDEDEKAWLAARTRGIGGSDIGAICGASNYSSARHIYFKKTGQYEEGETFSPASLERMRFGHLLEPIVADEYSRRTGRKLASAHATLVHNDYPWALANVDRIILDDTGEPMGILECKTAGEFMNDDWEDGEVPKAYLMQLQWYMFVTDLKFGAIAALVGGNKFYYYEVSRNEELITEMLAKATTFWYDNVEKLVPPDLDGSDASEEFVKNIEAKANTKVFLTEDIYNELAETVVDTKAKIKELESTLKEAQNRLKEAIGENVDAHTSDYHIKWAPRVQKRVDSDLLKKEYPQVYEDCLKTISFRVMTLKGGS
jgi:putative phage-type endonuclease